MEYTQMLTERHLDRYADILLWALKIGRQDGHAKNEVIVVRFHQPAVRLAEILHARLLKSGQMPVLRLLNTPTMEKDFYTHAGQEQLTFIPPGEKALYQSLNGSIFLYAPQSLTHLQAVDPKRIGQTARVYKSLRETLRRREEKGVFSWTLCLFPTKALARHAKLSQKAYAEQIVRACFLNRKSPVEHWQGICDHITEVKKWLAAMPIRRIDIESARVNLQITPGERRKWLGLSGHNIPSFEVFLSPDWRGTRGVYFADQPSFRSGNYVSDVCLTFKDGRVVSATARKGESFLKSQIDMDAGAARVGEFSLTDRRFSRIDTFMANTLYDENYGGRFGNCHIALGSAYTDSYDGDPRRLTPSAKRQLGLNDSALHWDLVNTEKKRVSAVLTSGKRQTIYENGQFTF